MEKLSCSYRVAGASYCYIEDVVPDEVLKACTQYSQIKEEYIKHLGLDFMKVKGFKLIFPVDLEDEEE